MAKNNIKAQTDESAPPKLGWAPLNARGRLLSQLDAATGRLTTDQQQYYADLPIEEFSTQPSTSNKIIQTSDGEAEYHQLVTHNAQWKDIATGRIFVNGAVRP